MAMVWRTLLQVLAVLVVFVGWLVLQQDSIIYHPRQLKRPLDLKRLQNQGIHVRELAFSTAEGKQKALAVKFGPVPARRLYAVFGGNAMVAREWLSALLQHGGASWRELAFVLVDYPGYGASDGKPSQAEIVRASVQAVQEARRELGAALAPDATLGALGHSIGCAAALQLAVELRGGALAPRQVMLSAPFTTLAEEAQAMLPFLSVVPVWLIAKLTSRNPWDNVAALAKLAEADVPPRVDIIHGTEDEIVPFRMGKSLSSHAKDLGLEVTFKRVKGDHNSFIGQQSFGKWLGKTFLK